MTTSTEATEKFRNLLVLLLEKSRQNAVPWRRANLRADLYDCQTFQADFAKELIQIEFVSPTADPDYYWARMLRGRTSLFSLQADENSPDWQLLADLYFQALRAAEGLDKALEEVEAALKSGYRAVPAQHVGTRSDDFPF